MSNFESVSINKEKTGEKVLVILREKIMLGQLKSGFHLKETVLSKELGVSRGPIREAITHLESEGLVSTHSNGRTTVEGFSMADLENLYNARINLETYAISQLTLIDIENGKSDLYRCLESMVKVMKKGSVMLKQIYYFMNYLLKSTGNKTLIQLWKSLHGIIKTLINVTSDYTGHQMEIIDEHILIVNYLEMGEFKRAQNQLEYHLKGALEFYKKAAILLERMGNKNEY